MLAVAGLVDSNVFV